MSWNLTIENHMVQLLISFSETNVKWHLYFSCGLLETSDLSKI